MDWLAVLVPDHGAAVDRYRPLVAELAAAGAVVDELPGPLVPDFEAAVDRLASVVDEHAGSPVVLVGHAVGGMIVVRYAQRYPGGATALVLSAPVLGPWPMLDLLSGTTADLLAGTTSTDLPAGLDRAGLAAIEDCLTTIDFDHPLGDELPALWVHGADDPRVPVADTRAGLDRVRGLGFEELIVPGGGHELLDEPAVRAEVVGFATRVVRPDGVRQT
jgi:alpha-beta hydrolase superfamily lysophospholipase